MYCLEACHITKTIKNEAILKDICFQMQSGRIYGIIGENGSGKSMLFRALSGLIHIDKGEILLDGERLSGNLSQYLKLGLTLENIGLYPELSAMDNLLYLAKIRGEIGKQEIKKVIARVGLDIANKKMVKTYSLGMKQKLILAQAIMEKPELLLLDEPTNALDEKSVKRVRHIIEEERERGALIVLTSHRKEDIDLLCDKTYRMVQGALEETV